MSEADRQGMLDRVFEFLGLEPFDAGGAVLRDPRRVLQLGLRPDSIRPDGDPRSLKIDSYLPMRDDTRRMLVDCFRPHNERLYDLLQRRFDWDR